MKKFKDFYFNNKSDIISGVFGVCIALIISDICSFNTYITFLLSIVIMISLILLSRFADSNLLYWTKYQKEQLIKIKKLSKKHGRCAEKIINRVIDREFKPKYIEIDSFLQIEETTFIQYIIIIEEIIKYIKEDKKIRDLCIFGSCFTLPHTFDINSAYARTWLDIYAEISKFPSENINCERILGNHQKKVLFSSINNNIDNFISFCSWHLKTGFKLLIFDGSLNAEIDKRNLHLNDFALFPKLKLGIGSLINKEEKNKSLSDRGEKNRTSFLSNKSSPKFAEYYKFYLTIKKDSKCKLVNLNESINQRKLVYENFN